MRKKTPLTERRLSRANGLLRRIYNIIEMNHLNDFSLSPYYKESFVVPKQLGEEIFNHLGSDPEFYKIFIKRQKRYRQRRKKAMKKLLHVTVN